MLSTVRRVARLVDKVELETSYYFLNPVRTTRKSPDLEKDAGSRPCNVTTASSSTVKIVVPSWNVTN